MSRNNQSKVIALGLLGAAVGAVVGYYAFLWIARHGLYAFVLPGGLLGLGAGVFARERSVPLATLCGISALGLGLFSVWHFVRFTENPGIGYFLTHIFSLSPLILGMVALGAFLGFRLALGRNAGAADQSGK